MKKFFFLFSIFSFFACSNKQQVDLIVHNAIVYTVDSSFSTAQSFAVKGGKFVAVGTNEEILLEYEAKELIDAQGKAIFPGFIDSHCHFYGYGKGLQELDLTGTKSFKEVIQKVVEYSKINTSEWIVGRGWDQNDWDLKEYPNRYELDILFPNTPIFLERIDGHAALANAQALHLANIMSETKVNGGVIELDLIPDQNNGSNKLLNLYSNSEIKNVKYPVSIPNGILIDNAVDLVKNNIPKSTQEQINHALLAAQKKCFEVGLTTVDDAGLEKNIINAIDELQKKGLLKMRVYAMLTDNKENFDYYLQNGIYKTERLNVRSFKCYADGALGSRGACLLNSYSDKLDERGFLLKSASFYDSVAKILFQKDFQMNTHCIGDSASRLIANVYNDVFSSVSQSHLSSYRWRIEHAQVLNKDDFKLYESIIPSIQPTHATSDMYWAKDRLGDSRVEYAYAYNDLLNSSGIIAIGTDFPVEHINPLYSFYAAVARKDLKGYPENGFQMKNALSRENTLKGMTIWGAYANFEEKEKGSIEIGKYADFILLENDIMKCDITKVPSTKVVTTFVNGEKVFSIQ
ncbi:MAG: amidohydrolase [Bacteroidia bacterium]|nr:amidohydrolase [Bacteroidia bacterium]